MKKLVLVVGVALLAGCSVATTSGTPPTPEIIYITAPPAPSAAIPTPIVIYVTPAPTATPAATAVPSGDVAVAGAGTWIVQATTADPISGKPTAIVYANSTSGETQLGKPIQLIIRCENSQTDFFINWGQFLGSSGPVTVTSRLGTAGARGLQWNLSTDNEATFYPSDPVAYVKTLFGQTMYAAQTLPYNASQVTAVWDITGVQNAVAGVRKACGW